MDNKSHKINDDIFRFIKNMVSKLKIKNKQTGYVYIVCISNDFAY